MNGSGILGSSLYLRYKSGHHQFSWAFEATGVEGLQSREESKGERKKSHWYVLLPSLQGILMSSQAVKRCWREQVRY